MIVGLAHGCFDVLHFGHVAHLEAARKLCDELTVVVTADQWVNKGPNRPVFTAQQRADVLRGLRCVERVLIGHGPDVAIKALQVVSPNRYFKGSEYRDSEHPGFKRESIYCFSHGVEIVFTDEDAFSSTEALRRLKEASQ